MSNVVQRTRAHTTAAVLNLAVSLFTIAFTLPVLFLGSDGANKSGDQPPFGVIVFAFALGLIGVLSSYGVWRGERWGVVVTIVVNALSFLSGAPGIFAAPTAFLQVASVASCALNVVIIYLLLRRRPAAVTAGASI